MGQRDWTSRQVHVRRGITVYVGRGQRNLQTSVFMVTTMVPMYRNVSVPIQLLVGYVVLVNTAQKGLINLHHVQKVRRCVFCAS